MALFLSASTLACSAEKEDESSEAPQAMSFPSELSGKADVFGRALIGIAQPYEPDLTLSLQEERLRTDMAFRRKVSWDIVQRVIDTVMYHTHLCKRFPEHPRVTLRIISVGTHLL